jgi:hypothetical protein
MFAQLDLEVKYKRPPKKKRLSNFHSKEVHSKKDPKKKTSCLNVIVS